MFIVERLSCPGTLVASVSERGKGLQNSEFLKKLKINEKMFNLHCLSSFPFGSGETFALGVLIRTFAAPILCIESGFM